MEGSTWGWTRTKRSPGTDGCGFDDDGAFEGQYLVGNARTGVRSTELPAAQGFTEPEVCVPSHPAPSALTQAPTSGHLLRGCSETGTESSVRPSVSSAAPHIGGLHLSGAHGLAKMASGQ